MFDSQRSSNHGESRWIDHEMAKIWLQKRLKISKKKGKPLPTVVERRKRCRRRRGGDLFPWALLGCYLISQKVLEIRRKKEKRFL